MPEQPIACSLSGRALALVTDQYARAARLYEGSIRFFDRHADVVLRGDKERLDELLRSMISRETTCCSFLRFDVEERMDGFRVRISVNGAPGIERGLLDQFVPVFFPGSVVEIA